MNDFLKTEYEQCLGLIKYYDERHHSLVMFCVGLSSAVPSLLLGFFQLGSEMTMYFWKFTALISGITAVGLLALFTVLIQTRLYFIYPARQVNAIRRAELQAQDSFTDNQMYLDTSFSAFKWTSSHTLLNLFVALQIGAFSGLATYAINFGSPDQTCSVSNSMGVGILITIVTFGGAAWYLHAKSKHHPDVSVHGQQVDK